MYLVYMFRITLTCVLFSTCLNAASGWDRLSELHAGDRIVVVQTDQKAYDGEFLRFSSDALTLRTGGSELTIERARILRVTIRKSRRTRNALIGAGIGVAIALAIDRTYGVYLHNETGYEAGTRALVWSLPIAIGAGAGAASPGYPTIYRAPRK